MERAVKRKAGDGIDPRDGRQLEIPLTTSSMVASAIARARFRWVTEADLQDGLAQVLEAAGLPFRREVILSDEDRIDFMVGGVGVEVKIKGAIRPTLAQLERYAGHEGVTELVLVTGRLQLTGMPRKLKGKPLRVLALVGSLFG